MDIVTAGVDDIDELTRVEIESKIDSIPQCVDSIEIDYAACRRHWETYMMGQSPARSKRQRVVLKAMVDGETAGYLAGHLTTRYGKDAEIQSFYILMRYQRQSIGTELLRRFADWMAQHQAGSLCVGFHATNPYQAFYVRHGGSYLNPHWIGWDDVMTLQRQLT